MAASQPRAVATQTRPPPAVMLSGRKRRSCATVGLGSVRRIVAVVRPLAGSTRVTVPVVKCATQIAPLLIVSAWGSALANRLITRPLATAIFTSSPELRCDPEQRRMQVRTHSADRVAAAAIGMPVSPTSAVTRVDCRTGGGRRGPEGEIRRAIADGEALPGERLPPARDMAAVLGVNANTVLRALRLLRDEGLLEFRRGRAIHVIGTPQHGVVLAKVGELVRFARRHGYRSEELIEMIRSLSG